MRISELTELSGLPMATVKYYLREGLLHPGRKVTARLVEYDQTHLDRLKLLRILREVGELPVERLKQLVTAVDSLQLTVHQVFARAADVTAPSPAPPGPDHAEAKALAADIVREIQWNDIRREAVDLQSLVSVLEVIATFAPEAMNVPALMPYLQAADDIGRFDLTVLDAAKDRTDLLEEMVVGQVVFGRLLTILRRLAEENYSKQRFGSLP